MSNQQTTQMSDETLQNRIEYQLESDDVVGKYDITVKAGAEITDARIITKIHWFFIGEDLLKGSEINVDQRVVTLKGTVQSAAGRARAVHLAKGTDGVKSVVDQLRIK